MSRTLIAPLLTGLGCMGLFVLATPWFASVLFPSDLPLAATQHFIRANHLAQCLQALLFVSLTAHIVIQRGDPYFLLMSAAWIAWIPLYGALFAQPLAPNLLVILADLLNTSFFWAAAVHPRHVATRNPPYRGSYTEKLWRVARVPVAALRHLFATPATWLPCAGLLVAVCVLHGLALDSQPVRSAAAALVVLVLGISTAQRVEKHGAVLAAACVFCHTLYTAPQVNAFFIDPDAATPCAFVGVYGPALVLKPMLGVLLLLVALREQQMLAGRTQRDLSKELLRILDVPEITSALLLVEADTIKKSNPAAQRLLGIAEHPELSLSALLQTESESFHLGPRPNEKLSVRAFTSQRSGMGTSQAISVEVQALWTNPWNPNERLLLLGRVRDDISLARSIGMIVHDVMKVKALAAERLLDALCERVVASPKGTGKPSAPLSLTRSALITKLRHARELVGQIRVGAETIRDTLKATRELNVEKVDVVNCLATATGVVLGDYPTLDLQVRVCDQEHDLDSQSAVSPLLVLASRDELVTVFKNLITNCAAAYQNLARDSQRRRSASSRRVQISVDRHDSFVRVRIQDDGPGFSEVVRSAINRRHSVAPNSIGLGYTTILLWIDVWGGELKVSNGRVSNDLPGATVELLLPSADLSTYHA